MSRPQDQQNLFMLLDQLDAAYKLTDWQPLRDHIHAARVEAERYLGLLIIHHERAAARLAGETRREP